MKNVADKSCRGNQNTRFGFNNFFRNCAIGEIMWKIYYRRGQATDDNMVNVRYMLDT